MAWVFCPINHCDSTRAHPLDCWNCQNAITFNKLTFNKQRSPFKRIQLDLAWGLRIGNTCEKKHDATAEAVGSTHPNPVRRVEKKEW